MKNTKKDLKSFAFICFGIFILIGFIPFFQGQDIRTWALILSLIFLIIGLTNPLLLQGFYKIWMNIGEFIGNIVSKIVLFILFYLLFTPIAFVLRVFGKDPLNKRIDKSQTSYWITRERQPESMKNQF